MLTKLSFDRTSEILKKRTKIHMLTKLSFDRTSKILKKRTKIHMLTKKRMKIHMLTKLSFDSTSKILPSQGHKDCAMRIKELFQIFYVNVPLQLSPFFKTFQQINSASNCTFSGH